MMIDQTAAIAWTTHVLADEERILKAVVDLQYRVFEPFQRVIAGPPPLLRKTGNIPEWWQPPSIDFRATEVMVWDAYRARATCCGFDSPSDTLWIFRYSCQHDRLWEEGETPDATGIDVAVE